MRACPGFITLTLLSVICLTGCSTKPVFQSISTASREETDAIQQLIKQDEALVAENARLKKEKEEAETRAYVALNKDELMPKLTERYRDSVPAALMEACGLHGQVLEFEVVDAAYQTNTLFMRQALLWKKADGSGQVEEFTTGLDVSSEKVVYITHDSQVPISAQELAEATGTGEAGEKQLLEKPSDQRTEPKMKVDWTPNNETINSGYQTVIKVAGTGLMLWLTHLATESN